MAPAVCCPREALCHARNINVFRSGPGKILIFAVYLALLSKVVAGAQGLRVTEISINSQGQFRVGYAADSSSYYVLLRGNEVTKIDRSVAVKLGEDGPEELVDAVGIEGDSQRFYRLRQVPRSASLDLDGDG